MNPLDPTDRRQLQARARIAARRLFAFARWQGRFVRRRLRRLAASEGWARHRRTLLWAAGATLVFLPALGWTLWTLSGVPSPQAAEQRRASSSLLWSRPVVLQSGDSVGTDELRRVLVALGYREVSGEEWSSRGADGSGRGASAEEAGEREDPTETGAPISASFVVRESGGRATFELFDRDRGRVELGVRRGRIQTISEGAQAQESVDLGPVPLMVYLAEDRIDRRPLDFEQIDPDVVAAVLAAEDDRFYRHGGLALRGIARAALRNLRAGEVVEGASTITQQVARNLFLTLDRSWWRKLREVRLAMAIEARWSKQDILEAYVNTIYLGARSGRQLVGCEAASRAWFGVGCGQLAVEEAALLAGMIAAPARFDPLRKPEAARQRRDWVIGRMVETGALTEEEASTARRQPLRLRADARLPWVDHVASLAREEMTRRAEVDGIVGGGYDIHTTLDWFQQLDAEAAAAELDAEQEVALVSLDAESGAVRAYLGGHPGRRSEFDRARRARRQMGSVAKPFVYAAAFDARRVLPISPVLDLPLRVRYGDREWMPGNAGGKYRGTTTVADALRLSLNTASVRVALAAGIDRVAATLESAGISDPVQGPSVALGAVEATPLEVVNAYRVFATGGVTGEPRVIEAASRRGSPLTLRATRNRRVVDEATAFLTLDALRGAVSAGTAWRVGRELAGREIAGKTGTSNEGRDAWFAGVEGDRVTVVWTGRDDFGAAHLVGGVEAAELFVGFAGRQAPAASIEPPASVRQVRVACGRMRRGYVPLELLRRELRDEVTRIACDVQTFYEVRPVLQFAGGVAPERERRRAAGGWNDLFRFGWSRRRSFDRVGESLFEEGWAAEGGRGTPPLVEEIRLDGPLGSVVERQWIWDREAASEIDPRRGRDRGRGTPI